MAFLLKKLYPFFRLGTREISRDKVEVEVE